MKTCIACKKEKGERFFNILKNKEYSSKCRQCLSEYRIGLYNKTKANNDYEIGVKDAVNKIKSLLTTQSQLRRSVGDEVGAEYYENALGWISYIDISNELSIDNGKRCYIPKATI